VTSLAGCRVLLVGSTGGLGQALTERLLARGARVIGVGRRPWTNSRLDQYVQADITRPDDRVLIVDAVKTEGVDVVILASGVVGFTQHDLLSSDAIDAMITTNLTAPLQLMALLSPLIRTGGNVTVLSGAVVDMPTLGMSTYTATKAGLSGFASVLRRELRSRKISVLDVRPPHTETGLATHPMFGSAPSLPVGLEPLVVAEQILVAIESDTPALNQFSPQ
jgi:cyclic-di-GMP-binding biofilm dispersal mediator protein